MVAHRQWRVCRIGQADPRPDLWPGWTEIEAEVLGTDPWIARMLLADRYRAVGSSWWAMPRTSIPHGVDTALTPALAMR